MVAPPDNQSTTIPGDVEAFGFGPRIGSFQYPDAQIVDILSVHTATPAGQYSHKDAEIHRLLCSSESLKLLGEDKSVAHMMEHLLTFNEQRKIYPSPTP